MLWNEDFSGHWQFCQVLRKCSCFRILFPKKAQVLKHFPKFVSGENGSRTGTLLLHNEIYIFCFALIAANGNSTVSNSEVAQDGQIPLFDYTYISQQQVKISAYLRHILLSFIRSLALMILTHLRKAKQAPLSLYHTQF